MDKSRDVKEWLRRAKGCLVLSKTKKIDDILYEDLCFNCQQCAEKALKGLIVDLGLEFPTIHLLNKLIKIIDSRLKVPENIKDCVDLNPYAVITRYPDDYYEITKEEYEKAVEIAERVYSWVKEQVK